MPCKVQNVEYFQWHCQSTYVQYSNSDYYKTLQVKIDAHMMHSLVVYVWKKFSSKPVLSYFPPTHLAVIEEIIHL